MRGYPSIKDDGTLVITPSNDKAYRMNINGEIIGVTNAAQTLIDKYNLNRDELVNDRKAAYLARESKFHNSPRGMVEFSRQELAVSLHHIRLLSNNSLALNVDNQSYFNNLLYSNTVTALEVFLSDYLVSKIESNNDYLESFVNNYGKWKDKVYPNKSNLEGINDIRCKAVKEVRTNILFHNLSKVKFLYESIFTLRFRLDGFPDFTQLDTAIYIRHDIVHRNGRDHTGNYCFITADDISELVSQVSDFASAVQYFVAEHEWKLNQ